MTAASKWILMTAIPLTACATASPPDVHIAARQPEARIQRQAPAPIPQVEPLTEVGSIDGAPYRIDVPPSWNGELVLYCHGYRGPPKPFADGPPDDRTAPFLEKGFAFARSTYSAGGYALAEGVRDTDALRRYFVQQIAATHSTWLLGESLGGNVALMLLETRPAYYTGALSLCSPLGPAISYIKTIVFDPLVLFQFWFPDVLPDPANVPSTYVMTLERVDQLTRLLDDSPAIATALRAYTTAQTNKELAQLLDFFTYVMGELELRWGGNPFDNRDTIYTGLGDDLIINKGVRRHAADPDAQRQAILMYTPTGNLTRPFLSVRTVYDPLISSYGSERYADRVRIAGAANLFAQKFVAGSGHCGITPQEQLAGLRELQRWVYSGFRPAPGLLSAPVLH